MKKIILSMMVIGLSACSTPKQQSTVPMDMQTVYEYHHRVNTKQTVNPNETPKDEPLNQSDRRGKSTRVTTVHPVIYPSVRIGYHHGRGYRYWY